MASAHEIAIELLTRFSENVVARRGPYTYGHYATAIGKDPKEYGLAIGQAMHAIGALCIIRQIPVAPLYWVERADGREKSVFESNYSERSRIIDSGDINIIEPVARAYIYSAEEFIGIQSAMQKSLASGNLSKWSPHDLWLKTFIQRPKGNPLTYYECAMARYRALHSEFSRIKRQ